MFQKPLVSIIVPVYNTNRFLAECIQSLLALSTKMASLEVVLVDDGSTDGSGEMCDGYALKDDRVRVIHQENQGVSAARNTGVHAAVGDYLVFVDSGDYVHPALLDEGIKIMMLHHADMIVCRSLIVDEHGKAMKQERITHFEVASGINLYQRIYLGERLISFMACWYRGIRMAR